MIHTNYQNRADKRIIAKLNGIWEIEPGEMNSPPTKFTHRVEVPSLIDCATPSYDWRTHDFHWYRRTFFAEENQKGRPAFLKIEQSMFGTAVRVNGSLAGESSARIDGCSDFRIYWQIILPLAKPALVTLGIFTFLGTWNDFMWPLIVLNRDTMYTLPVALANLMGEHAPDTELMMAGSVVTILPIMILFLALQKSYVSGLVAGSLKE